MATEAAPLRFYFIPFPSPGHMIPMLDIAKLFALRGVAATVITTPGNVPHTRPFIDRHNSSSSGAASPIDLVLIPFPPSVAAQFLPHGKENMGSMARSEYPGLYYAVMALQAPLQDFLVSNPPDCIVCDRMFSSSADMALQLKIPMISFCGPGIFLHCVHQVLEKQLPPKLLAEGTDETFTVQGIPHHIEMSIDEVSFDLKHMVAAKLMREAEAKGFGMIVNSFYELEEDYAELYRKNITGGRAYYVGPVWMSGESGGEDPCGSQWLMDEAAEATKKWLDSKGTGSVMYVSFGSLNDFSAEQLQEIASGLEGAGSPFVWVVKENCVKVPKGIQERIEGKGLLIRGWAPQILILNHQAVGGFVTHCGWNSTLEAVVAGVPMVTWPVEYDQFVNGKLIVEVLKIGVSVGRGEAGDDGKKVVKAAAIADAVKSVMGDGEEAQERRARVRNYAAMAKAAIKEGGSSYGDISRVIEDVQAARTSRCGLCCIGEDL